jgi:hypothetical protein
VLDQHMALTHPNNLPLGTFTERSLFGATHMKMIAILIVGIAASTAAFAQESRYGAGQQNPPAGQTVVKPPSAPDSRTTGQAPARVPGVGDPHGAKGGGVGLEPNPDRVPHPGN